jgi:hypothetical protein
MHLAPRQHSHTRSPMDRVSRGAGRAARGETPAPYPAPRPDVPSFSDPAPVESGPARPESHAHNPPEESHALAEDPDKKKAPTPESIPFPKLHLQA